MSQWAAPVGSFFSFGRKMDTLPIDELNNLKSYLDVAISRISVDEAIDDVLDVLIVGWANGLEYAASVLGGSYLDYTDLQESLEKRIDGKNYADRVREHFENGDVDGIIRVADTESHRLYNESVFESAKRSGKEVYKTWVTMGDDKVRDPHVLLDGVTIPLDELFYTDGVGAKAPGMFGVPELDINCRCIITLTTS